MAAHPPPQKVKKCTHTRTPDPRGTRNGSVHWVIGTSALLALDLQYAAPTDPWRYLQKLEHTCANAATCLPAFCLQPQSQYQVSVRAGTPLHSRCTRLLSRYAPVRARSPLPLRVCVLDEVRRAPEVMVRISRSQGLLCGPGGPPTVGPGYMQIFLAKKIPTGGASFFFFGGSPWRRGEGTKKIRANFFPPPPPPWVGLGRIQSVVAPRPPFHPAPHSHPTLILCSHLPLHVQHRGPPPKPAPTPGHVEGSSTEDIPLSHFHLRVNRTFPKKKNVRASPIFRSDTQTSCPSDEITRHNLRSATHQDTSTTPVNVRGLRNCTARNVPDRT